MLRLFGGENTGGFSGEKGSIADDFSYAAAHLIAMAGTYVERAWRNRFARSVYENLEEEEEEHGLHPGPMATVHERRAALAAKKMVNEGSRREALETALERLLGSNYVGIHVTHASERVMWPATLGAQPMNLQPPGAPRKLIRLLAPISIGLGAPQYVPYEGVVPTTNGFDHPLFVGEKIFVEPEIMGRAETVTISDLEIQNGQSDADPTTLLLRATFNNAHEPNCLATTKPMPIWTSSQREIVVVVKQPASVNLETRRQVHELLRSMLTGVTTWALAGETNPEEVGGFVCDHPEQGLLDSNTLGNAAVP